MSRSRRIHGEGESGRGSVEIQMLGVWRGGWRTQQSAIVRSGGGNPVSHLVGWLVGNNIDDAINNDNIDDNNMMMEMMMIPIT